MVADHSKLGARSRWTLCPVAEIETLITDTGATDEAIASFERTGIKVVRV